MLQHLLKAPDARLRHDLELAAQAVEGVFPLKSAHKKELPFAVRDLSRLLTAERGQSRGYWEKPALTGAYLYYFLPWNLLRLAWLLRGLGLDIPPGARVLDLGSGPLTLPLGLWLARPDLRGAGLNLSCSDTAQRPMDLGRKIFEGLAAGEERWRLELTRAPLEVALRKAGRVKLIMAGNVLNEVQAGRASLEERLTEIFYSMDRALEDKGQIFIMEPGTRLGGKLVALMRRIALEEDYQVEGPCTHERLCPYAPASEDEDAPKRKGPPPGGWCHFTLPSDGAPEALAALSAAAGLEKERLSLSCLLLRKGGGKVERAPREKAAPRALGPGIITPVRVVSDPIRLPGRPAARYVCSAHGLGLLQDALEYKSGMAAEAFLPDKGARDAKSGALLMRPAVNKKS